MNLIHCDEAGSRVLGFTVNGQPMATWEVKALGEIVWASSVELLVWLSRTPGYWGAFAASATFRVWNAELQQVVDVTVQRKDTEAPIERDDLLAA